MSEQTPRSVTPGTQPQQFAAYFRQRLDELGMVAGIWGQRAEDDGELLHLAHLEAKFMIDLIADWDAWVLRDYQAWRARQATPAPVLVAVPDDTIEPVA